jgi:hypothetical protein
MSLFREGKPKITLLFKEVLGEIIEQQPELMLGLAIELAAEEAGLPLPDIEALAERMQAEAPKPTNPATAKAKTPGPKSNGFAAKYTAWLGSLKSDQLCLWLADYDIERARSLYCDTEIDLVKAMVELKTAETWQEQRIRFEACLLGFGGELKGQNSITHDVDLTDQGSVDSMIEAMKRMGF